MAVHQWKSADTQLPPASCAVNLCCDKAHPVFRLCPLGQRRCWGATANCFKDKVALPPGSFH